MSKLYKTFSKISLIALSLTLAITVTGCGGNMFENVADDSSKAARLEEANIALDDGNYDDAIKILSEMNTDNPADKDLAVDLASAHMGRAGFDIIEIIGTVGLLAENSGATSDSDTLSIFTDLFDFADDQKTEDMQLALGLLSDIDQKDRTEGDSLLLAVAATSDIILTLGSTVLNGFDENGVPILKEGENELPTGSELTTASTTVDGETVSLLTRIETDLFLLSEGVTGSNLGAENDLNDEITSIDAQLDPDGNNTISGDELAGYLTGLSATP